MKTNIIVFQEGQYHFGINPDEFESGFSLNSAWISPSETTSYLWKFERKSSPENGDFLHFGLLLGLTSAYFNNGSQVFMKETPEKTSIGICISSTIFRIALKGNKEIVVELDESNQFPASLPKTVFSRILRYKQKNIYVIDPILLFRAYQFLF